MDWFYSQGTFEFFESNKLFPCQYCLSDFGRLLWIRQDFHSSILQGFFRKAQEIVLEIHVRVVPTLTRFRYEFFLSSYYIKNSKIKIKLSTGTSLDDFWWKNKSKTLNKPYQQSSPRKPQTFKKSIIQKYCKKNTHSKNTAYSTQFEIL